MTLEPTTRTPDSEWFWDHYENAAKELVEFCRAGGVELGGRAVADIGCGDGILALGVCHRARPAQLVGFDIVPTDADALLVKAQAEGVADSLPGELEFKQSAETALPCRSDSVDVAYSWSSFEHIAAPVEVLDEINRILRPEGCLFIQLWPFYRSSRGSHLWPWFDDEFHHLIEDDQTTTEKVRASDRHDPAWTEYMLAEFESLNRITVEELQRSLLAAGFEVRRLELLTQPMTLTPPLSRYSWTDLGIGGVKLLAVPRR